MQRTLVKQGAPTENPAWMLLKTGCPSLRKAETMIQSSNLLLLALEHITSLGQPGDQGPRPEGRLMHHHYCPQLWSALLQHRSLQPSRADFHLLLGSKDRSISVTCRLLGLQRSPLLVIDQDPKETIIFHLYIFEIPQEYRLLPQFIRSRLH